jgi:hypothetical protein
LLIKKERFPIFPFFFSCSDELQEMETVGCEHKYGCPYRTVVINYMIRKRAKQYRRL